MHAPPPIVALFVSSLLGGNFPSAEGNFTQCSLPSQRYYKWLSYSNGTTCYLFQSWIKADYFGAEKYCRDRNGTLLSVHSQDENDLIVKLTEKGISYHTPQTVWLGLQRDPESGLKEQWSDGSAIDYANWNTSQDEPTQHCAYMKINARGKDEGRWFHHNCGENSWFVCQRSENDTLSPSPPTPAAGECPDGWIRYNDICYMINLNKRPFDVAAEECRSWWKSDLVSIHSEKQQGFVTALLGSTNETSFWLGAYKGKGYRYLWKSNARFYYSNWLPGHPVYSYPEVKCVRILMRNPREAGKWEDVVCDHELPFICQKPISPRIVLPSSAQFPPPCPNKDDYFQYKSACFKIYGYLSTWEDAQSTCAADSGSLASVNNKLEYEVIKELVRRQNVRDIWIGMKGYRLKHEAFHWTDGSPLYFTNWGDMSSSNSNGTQCVVQETSGLWTPTSHCEDLKAFACKIHLGSKPDRRVKRLTCPPMNQSVSGKDRLWVDLDPGLDDCYSISSSADSYGAAQFNCYLYGGNLASIHSEHQMNLLAAFATDGARRTFRRDIWIGLHRNMQGGFQWTDGTAADFFSWRIDEPGNDTQKRCVATNSALENWETRSCKYTYAMYICSVKKVPVPNDDPLAEPVRRPFLAKAPFGLFILAVVSALIVAGVYTFKFVQRRQGKTEDKAPFMGVSFARQRFNNEA